MAEQTTLKQKHHLIVGLDFGHGEVAAHYMREKVIDPLTLDGNTKDKCIMTTLVYSPEGKVFIGAEASNLDSVEAYFKASPAEWEEMTEGGHKKKDLMRDFIRQLFVQIKKANEPLGVIIDPNTTLLLVGCPTSEVWTNAKAREAYAKLVREATGIRDVLIVPESRAAIFSAFYQVKNLVLDTTKGVAVFDFGSSTADFTYYLLGKTCYEFNCRLGGAQIEQAIVKKLMDQLQDAVFQSDMASKELEVRKLKEAFFTAVQHKQGFNKPIALEFVKMGYGGKPVQVGINRRTGNPIYDKAAVSGRMDDETIEWATERYQFALPEDVTHAKRTWYKHCKHFFETARNYLEQNAFPCQTIVITGGASKMDFVRELCQEIFPTQSASGRIYVEENPSYSVSVGLCYLAHGQEVMWELLEAGKAERHTKLKAKVDALVENIARGIATVYYDRTCTAMRSLSGKITVGKLTDTIKAELEKITSKELETIIRKQSNQWGKDTSDLLFHEAKEIVKKMYPGLEGAFRAVVAKQHFDVADMILNPDSIMGTVDMMSTVSGIVVNIIGGLVALGIGLLLGTIPIVGPVIAVFGGFMVAGLLAEWISQNREFSLGDAARNLKRYESKKEESIQQMTGQIKAKVQEQLTKQMGEGYAAYLEQMDRATQNAVEIMALQSFPGEQQ